MHRLSLATSTAALGLALAVSSSACGRDAQALTPEKMEQQYGVAGAYSDTVTTPDGRTVTRRVEDKKNLAGVNVGDLIDITYTRATLMSVERAK